MRSGSFVLMARPCGARAVCVVSLQFTAIISVETLTKCPLDDVARLLDACDDVEAKR